MNAGRRSKLSGKTRNFHFSASRYRALSNVAPLRFIVQHDVIRSVAIFRELLAFSVHLQKSWLELQVRIRFAKVQCFQKFMLTCRWAFHWCSPQKYRECKIDGPFEWNCQLHSKRLKLFNYFYPHMFKIALDYQQKGLLVQAM